MAGERLTLKETLLRIFPEDIDDGIRKMLYISVHKRWRVLYKKYMQKHGETEAVVDGKKRRDLPVDVAIRYGSDLCLRARNEFLAKCAHYGIYAATEEDPELADLEHVPVSDTESEC